MDGEPGRTGGSPVPGFSLIATISILVLLALIAVGLLTLSTTSVRSTKLGDAERVARANARMALVLAIGELQKATGDDRRITADASILGEVSRPHAVGVWESWSPQMALNPQGRAPDYAEEKEQRFLRWLVSGPDEDLVSRNWVESSASSTDQELFQVEGDGYSLRAPVVEVETGGAGGGFAWAVSQENTRAKVNVAGPERDERITNDDLQAQPRPSLALSDLFSQPGEGWDLRASKVLSYAQTELDPDLQARPGSSSGRAHFTTSAMGLLTNVVEGGLKGDLSLGMEMDEGDFNAPAWSSADGSFRNPFHADAEDRFSVYGAYGSQRPLYRPLSTRGTHELKRSFWPANVHFHIPSNTAPTFHTLRSFCRMPHHLYRTQDGLTVFEREADHVAGTPGRVDRGYFPPPPFTCNGQRTQIGVRPVLDRVMFLVSAALTEDDRLSWGISPVITLWNPYNVALEIEGAVSHIWLDIPFFIRWKVYDRRLQEVFNREMYTSGTLSEQFIAQNHGRSVNPYFYAAITSTGRPLQSGSVAPIRFEPGEVRVFAPAEQKLQLYRVGDSIRQRTLFLRPVDDLAQLSTKGGLLLPTQNQKTGWGFTYKMEQSQFAQLAFYPAQGEDYPFYIALEDATRAKGADPTHEDRGNAIADVLANAFARSGRIATFESPRTRYSQLKREPVPIGVLEVYHRVAKGGTEEQAADVAFTGNPRQPWMNPFISGANFESGPQYQIRMRSVSSFNGVLQTTNGGRSAFYGASQSPVGGRTHLSFFEVPQAPLLSLAALQHADLSATPFSPANQFANSWASAYVSRDRVAERTQARPVLGLVESDRMIEVDHCYLINESLWDQWFFSGAAPTLTHSGGSGSTKVWERQEARISRSLSDVMNDFVDDPVANPLRNPRMRLHLGNADREDLARSLLNPEGCLKIAAHLTVDGAFNINSTDVEAWKAMLTGLRGARFQAEERDVSSGEETPFPRFRDPVGIANDDWHGFRTLSDEEIESLAQELVGEIRERGPFLSLGEFINRRIEKSELGLKGALQAAIDKAGLNGDFLQEQFSTTSYESSSRENVQPSDTGVGIPGYLTQADVLKPLSPVITARSDTFTIRAYGEAKGADGQVLARSWAEATVQRMPEFVDASAPAYTPIPELDTINETFGRQFRVLSFRYLPNPQTTTASSS